jgi:uncharacterized membrane protein (DUF373 family)
MMKNTIENRLHCPESDIKKYWGVMTLYERFEHIIAIILSIIISVIVILALAQLVRDVYNELILNALNPLDHKVFKTIFGMIMTLLIAMEFKHSILTVLRRNAHIVQARAVIIIALLALSRKLIIMDFSVVKPEKLVALGLVILVLGIVYYFLKKTDSDYLEIGKS